MSDAAKDAKEPAELLARPLPVRRPGKPVDIRGHTYSGWYLYRHPSCKLDTYLQTFQTSGKVHAGVFTLTVGVLLLLVSAALLLGRRASWLRDRRIIIAAMRALGWIVALTACWVAIQAFKETDLPTDSGDSYRMFGVYLEFLAPLSALVGMYLSRQRRRAASEV